MGTFDVTVVGTTKTALLSQASKRAEVVLVDVEERKKRNNAELGNVNVITLGMETMGGMNEDFHRTVKKLAKGASDRSRKADETAAVMEQRIYQRLSISTQRYNGDMLLKRVT